MRKHIQITALLAACCASPVLAATAVTEPVGYTAQTLAAGAQTLGLTLNKPALFVGTVVDNDSTGLLLDTAGITLGSVLNGSGPCYAEVTGGLAPHFVGDRFDIDVAATNARQDGFLVLRPAAHNTMALPLPAHALSGCRVALKEHLTLAGVFGTGSSCLLNGSSEPGAADQVLTYQPSSGAFVVYYPFRNAAGTIQEWRQAGAPGTRDDTILPPAGGLFVRRNRAEPLEFVLEGAVRMNDFVLPLAAGYNFVALPFPDDRTPAALQMVEANGFVAGPSAGQADQILLFNGSSYDTWFLAAAAPDSGVAQWRGESAGAGLAAAQTLPAASSFFLRKAAADPDFVIARALQL